jgi:hypothetical protein
VVVPWAGAAHGGAARSQQERVAAGCASGDTSSSCRLLGKQVVITNKVCKGKSSPCLPVVIHAKGDRAHPYGFDIVPPTSDGSVPAQNKRPQANMFSILVPKVTGGKSIQTGDSIYVQEDTTGAFTLRILDKRGHKLASWTPPLKLVAPRGARYLETLTRAGWQRVDPNRVQTPGMYRWVTK